MNTETGSTRAPAANVYSAPAGFDTPARPNLLVRLMRGLWRGIDGFRKVLHLILMLIFFLLLLGAISGGTPILPDKAALLIQPAGFLVEELEGDPYDRAIEELLDDTRPQTLVQDIVDALAFAADDRRIEAVHLDLSGFAGGGLTKLQRVATAIEEFQQSGKPVIATGDFMSQGGFYLAAHADEAYLHPEGVIWMPGYGSFRTYFKDAIDFLRLDWNIFRVGTHKTFIEPYTRMDMSDEARESTVNLIDQLWTMYSEDVETARALDPGTLDAYTIGLIDNVRMTGGDIAAAALADGLVDDLMTRVEVRRLIADLVGEDPDSPETYQAAGLGAYLAQMRMLEGGTARDENVAIVIAAGEIVFGSRSPGVIGAESTSLLLRQALSNESVKAVVLRVDSPGGSAFASDILANEVKALQDAGKPVVASMSSAAASGGYWISAGADQILASPATITGSIGIFGMFPTYQRTADALGIGVDGVGTTPWAGELRPDREMSEHAKELFQLIIEDGYLDFITRVSDYRGMAVDEVDAIAQGKVWTGADALEFGLIDQLGDLDDAVEVAAELAGLEDGSYGQIRIRQTLSPTEQLIVDLLGAVRGVGLDTGVFVSRPGTLQRVATRVEEALSPLVRFNDPKGVYAHCFCEFN